MSSGHDIGDARVMVESRSASVPALMVSESASTIQTVSYDGPIAATALVAVRSVPFPTPVDYTSCSVEGSHSVSSGSAWYQLRHAPSQQNGKSLGNGFTTLPEAGASTTSSRSLLNSIPSINVNKSNPRPVSGPVSCYNSRWSNGRWDGLRGKKSGKFNSSTDSTGSAPLIQAPSNSIALGIPGSVHDGRISKCMGFPRSESLMKEDMRRQREQQIGQEEARRRETGQPTQDGKHQQERIPVQREQVPPDIASPVQYRTEPETLETPSTRSNPVSTLRVRNRTIPLRAISADEDLLSRRVRLMYEKGEENVADSEVARSKGRGNGVLWGDASTRMEASPHSGCMVSNADAKGMVSYLSTESAPGIARKAQELAGGINLSQNIKSGDVDRYGFIRPPTSNFHECIDIGSIQCASASPLVTSEAPRRKHAFHLPSTIADNRSCLGLIGRSPTQKLSEPSIGPTFSHSMYSTTIMRRLTSQFCRKVNRLPHNHGCCIKNKASSMLIHPKGSASPDDKRDAAAARATRKKEREREDKWTKMARPMRTKDGGGMAFEFDTTSSKLIERTWKGIPERWRATAWYSFMKSSARLHSESPSEEELIEAFTKFQSISSPDDGQINIDVPRTITSHIMFGRRYRGGQRLLFRVLHAMSLYFPDTGYVQGMASLATTLLIYYDEEHAFIMLVRLWQLRGLGRLYQLGFSGLMEALGDFEREWLEKEALAAKLNELGVPATAYGTRWYLTLFNYCIPFPAQLRVWDVFMLLGDANNLTISWSSWKASEKETPTSVFGNELDVLHATSAALFDGMRDIILNSDFDNAMKVLTSSVPIKDIELFMRVAKREWRAHRRKKTS